MVIEAGAWADNSSFAGVVRRLQRDGCTVDVPPNPLQGLAYDAQTLAGFLGTISGPIVLVGHSYGGMVITNAAAGNPNVKALVYVDAFIPAHRGGVRGALRQVGDPRAARPLFQAAAANFALHSQAAVDTANQDRGPLLLISGTEDHTVPDVSTRSTLKQYRYSAAVAELKQFEHRGHSLTIDSGWKEIAAAVLEWLHAEGA